MNRLLAIGALACALAGCGTVANFNREAPAQARPYGGVEIAAENFRPSSEMAAVWLDFLWPLAAVDVVLSAVGDTLTLPFAAWPMVERAWYFTFIGIDNTPPRSSDAAPDAPPAP